MLVSVIIPAFNAQSYVTEAIASACNQTEPDLEVIVVDDASSDGTAATVRSYSYIDARVRGISLSQNVGPGQARNYGIRAARGSWIALLDADDRYHPSRLERLLSLACRKNADVVSDNIYLTVDGSVQSDVLFSRKRLPTELRLTAADFVRQNCDSGGRRGFGFMQPLMSRKFLQEGNLLYPLNTRFGEDYLFYLDCLVNNASWWVTPEPLYFYSVRAGSLTETVRKEDYVAIRDSEDHLIKRFQHKDPDLFEALVRHKKEVDGVIYVMSFKEKVLSRSFFEALSVFFESKASIKAIVMGVIGLVRRRILRKRGGW